MKRYSLTEVGNVLDQLGITTGDTVLVQSALVDLGIPRDVDLTALAQHYYNIIRSRIGDSGTICAQGFSFGPCQGEVFDGKTTVVSTGAFAEYLRHREDALRSPHPIQSVIASGPNAASICASDTSSGYDADGPYGRLIALDAKLLLIGRRNVQTGSCAHYAEEQQRVPYRYWKTFPIRYRKDGQISRREYQMFVRDLNIDPQTDVTRACTRLEQSGIIRSLSVGGSDIRVASARELTEEFMKMLSVDPWCLVKARRGGG